MERYSIVFINTADNKVKFTLNNNTNPDLKGGMNRYSGILWHKGNEGDKVYWSVVSANNRSFVASAKWDGSGAVFSRMFEYKKDKEADMALPNEILINMESAGEFL